MSQLINFQRFCNVYFTKLLEDDRIPTNIDINEGLWTGMFGENEHRKSMNNIF